MEQQIQNKPIGYPPFGAVRRRQLLPWWIKAFTWLFMLGISVVVGGIFADLSGRPVRFSLFGLYTNDGFSAVGIFIMVLYMFKGITAVGLWFEKNWGIMIAKIDAISSMVICVALMIYTIVMPRIHGFSLWFEIVVILLYYLKMRQIEQAWQNLPEYPKTISVE